MTVALFTIIVALYSMPAVLPIIGLANSLAKDIDMPTLPDAETISTQTLSSNELVEELMRENTAEHFVDVIETVISSLDQSDSAMVSNNDTGHVWKFNYGSVEVFVQLTGETDDDSFTTWAAVLNLPANNEAQLFRKLLEMNGAETLEARFAILNNQVVALATRSVADLSPSEISRAITIVATIADNHDEALQAEFSAG